ncbi:MAG: DUF3127 domain-containing protein [Bacteroidetes bacterium]|nr:DUF3127 domain-containing protein [Bacteroidota bacterium]
MTLSVQGKIVEIFSTIQVNEKFKKREFVVEYIENSQYPEYLKFEFNHDKCTILDNYKADDFVELHFNLKGRAFNNQNGGKNYYNTLQAWKILKIDPETRLPLHPVRENRPPQKPQNSFNDMLTNSTNVDDE